MSLISTYNSKKALLVQNLESMGVTGYTVNDGLTTLINAILEITGSVGGLIINTSFDCNISQNTVYLGDSVTLTGKLNAEFNDISSEDDDLSGVIQHGTVKIYNGDTLIGSVQTGNDGSFSFSYTPNSTGALSLKAIYESNTYSSSYSSSFVVNVLELSLDEIVLTSDKSILSYSDHETATLSAQLMYDGVSVAVGNVPVSFMVYDENDVLLDTLNGVTDSTGLATVSYHSQGTGNISIKATTSNIFSNNIQIEDIYWHPRFDGTESFTQFHGTTTIADGIMSGASARLDDGWDNTIDWELSFDFKTTATASGIFSIIPTSTTARDTDEILIVSPDQTSICTIYGGGAQSSIRGSKSQSADTWYTCTMQCIGDNLTINVFNGIFTWGFDYFRRFSELTVGVDSWGGTASIKNVKLKQL